MHIRNKQNFWSGVMFLAFGAFFAGFGTQYSMGSAAKMGPGYFPTALGVILAVMGAAIAIGAAGPTAHETHVDRFHFRELGLVLGAVVLFGVLLKPLGLILSLLVLVLVSSFASHEFSWKAALLNAIILIVLCYAVFIWALKLIFPLWPAFLGLY